MTTVIERAKVGMKPVSGLPAHRWSRANPFPTLAFPNMKIVIRNADLYVSDGQLIVANEFNFTRTENGGRPAFSGLNESDDLTGLIGRVVARVNAAPLDTLKCISRVRVTRESIGLYYDIVLLSDTEAADLLLTGALTMGCYPIHDKTRRVRKS